MLSADADLALESYACGVVMDDCVLVERVLETCSLYRVAISAVGL